MNSRLTLSAVAAAAALFLSTPDASAQAKSDIKADPNSSSCTENCNDAGYEWAEANMPTQDADCAAANEDFAAGCAHWLEEKREAGAPPPEEPAEAAAAEASAEASADAADSANSTQTDDSAAPPSDAPADPPQNQ